MRNKIVALLTALSVFTARADTWLVKPKPGNEHSIVGKWRYLEHVKVGIFQGEAGAVTAQASSVESDQIITVEPQTVTPADPLWANQWDMQKISMSDAWGISQGSADVVVGVCDTGIDYTHPDLLRNLYTAPDGSHGWQCYQGVLQEGGSDVYGHGTHCAGTIGAAANNGVGMAGMNWNVKLISFRFLNSNGSGFLSDAVILFDKMIELKQQGLNLVVVNDSWGGTGFSQALKDGFTALENAGILSAVAAGNSALNDDTYFFEPASLDSPSIVSVIATDASDARASFSNWGLVNTDIAAPGVSTLSTLPTNPALALHSSTGYGLLSGTSMATPHVTGLIALLKAVNPSLSAQQLKDILLDAQSYDSVSDFYGSLTSSGGRINAYKALTSRFLFSPKTNHAPVITDLQASDTLAGNTASLTFSASDQDNDALQFYRYGVDNLFPPDKSNTLFFQTPIFSEGVSIPVHCQVSDRNGGATEKVGYVNVFTNPALPLAQYGVRLTATPAGTYPGGYYYALAVDFTSNSDSSVGATWVAYYETASGGGGAVKGNELIVGGTYHPLAMFPSNEVSKVYAVARNAQLTQVRTPDQVFTFGLPNPPAGTWPKTVVNFDKVSGAAPLTVTADFSASANAAQYYVVEGAFGTVFSTDPHVSFTLDTPGLYVYEFTTDATGSTAYDIQPQLISVLASRPGSTNPPPVQLNQVFDLRAAAGIQLTWTDNSTGEDRYEVEVAKQQKNKQTAFTRVATLSADSTNFRYQAAPTKPATVYSFRVRAALGSQFAPYSNIVQFKL